MIKSKNNAFIRYDVLSINDETFIDTYYLPYEKFKNVENIDINLLWHNDELKQYKAQYRKNIVKKIEFYYDMQY